MQRWSPQIGDPEVTGWLTVRAYAFCAMLALARSRPALLVVASTAGKGWAGERTPAWLTRFRRLAISYERRRADIYEAFVILGCALICLNQFRRFR